MMKKVGGWELYMDQINELENNAEEEKKCYGSLSDLGLRD